MVAIKKLGDLKIKIFADGADLASMVALAKDPLVKGFTTNPTLMRKAGVTDYAAFAKEVLAVIKDKPVSFEVFSDDFVEMERQARLIASWASNVYVKIPITNTKGEPSYGLIKRLSADGIKLNVTAILPLEQVEKTLEVLSPGIPAIISIFAGRIADAGVDPVPIMRAAKTLLRSVRFSGQPHEILWASPREALNIVQAEELGVDIITATPDIIKKAAATFGKDLGEFSLDTVKMFYSDGQAAGYKL